MEPAPPYSPHREMSLSWTADSFRATSLDQGPPSGRPLAPARNRGSQPVLVLEGEAIVGAKQNRTVVASVLVGAGLTVSIPAGAGLWHEARPAHLVVFAD